MPTTTLQRYVEKAGGTRKAAQHLAISESGISRRLHDGRPYQVEYVARSLIPIAWWERVPPGRAPGSRKA